MPEPSSSLSSPWDSMRSLSAPARRALLNAGILELTQLAQWTRQDLLALHGMGPKALEVLQAKLAEQGLDFREAP